ncbi:TPA: hypothetical protein QDZ66_004529 [Pluralibacter gergoviae]|uniref:Membrane protein n=1 Tax=Pluralibacter gergoviae TaxID=61647 RepID=A0A089PPN5_PLUGE|nr:DUF2231 domain-containing protein [Pluralibacter gergoviae]AIR00846.1 hypothetical protein LG71_13455 [Pluralibacter gergoviae]EKT9638762.1 hypothetical protein [Pluralibacter gergoviae]EKV0931066.1 hypothetical protein [Pluralibacter gergoviae]EKV6247810.1 hypothetical protein [Pluralibacter gergoviae]EKW9966530.1 hypothetical protein [Pluralibacter gergoviae]
MRENSYPQKNRFAAVIYNLLNPIPYGLFIAAFIFDIIYLYSTNVMWGKSASWLIAFGLIFAIIPRLINLFQVWVGGRWPQLSAVKIHFWLNLVAIVAAILNSFVHSRDAYAIAPQNVIYSAITVGCLLVANIALSLGHVTEDRHD